MDLTTLAAFVPAGLSLGYLTGVARSSSRRGRAGRSDI